jgi:hypothetical protein
MVFHLRSAIFAATFVLISVSTSAAVSWSVIEQNIRKAGGSLKAFSHMRCFVEELKDKRFPMKESYGSSYESNRCSSMETLELGDKRYMTLIDYTKPGTKRRMYLIDKETGAVQAMGVAHGRYQSGYTRLRTKNKKNSIKWAKYFSNTPGSNAPSSGFFLAGQEYEGKFGRSLILHGLEEGINDNACPRAVVIHKHLLVSKRRAYVMSSGCPMVSHSNIDTVIDALKGEQSGIKLTNSGGLVFIYGPREREWSYGSCPL